MLRICISIIVTLMFCGCYNTHTLTPDQIKAECENPELSRPFMVGWDSNRQDELSAAYGKNNSPIFLKYERCEMRILADCHQDVKRGVAYEVTPLPLHDEQVEIKDQKSLYATLPLAAATLKGKISSKRYLLLHYRKNRTGQLELKNLGRRRVGSECSQATHYVDQVVFGAYHLKRVKRLDIGFFASIFGGAESEEEMRWEIRRGDLDACSAYISSSRSDAKCSSIISLGVRRISKLSSSSSRPSTPSSSSSSSLTDSLSSSPSRTSTSSQPPSPPPRTSRPSPSTPVERIQYAMKLLERGGASECRESLELLRGLANVRRSDISGHSYFLRGYIYMKGCGVSQDLDRAVALYREAAKRGHQKATQLIEQLSTAQLKRAIELIINRRCAEGIRLLQHIIQNSGDAMLSNKANYNIGVAYARGCDAAPDLGRAAAIYQRLAEHNYPPALRALGLMYVHGQHFDRSGRNRRRGLELLKAAADLGDDEAKRLYRQLSR